MFLRKLLVILVPLLLAGLLCVVCPLVAGWIFWSDALTGLLLGVSLALLLPLSGASRRREPFAGLLWLPLLALLAVVTVQALAVQGVAPQQLGRFASAPPAAVLVECAFTGYLAVQVLRTKK